MLPYPPTVSCSLRVSAAMPPHYHIPHRARHGLRERCRPDFYESGRPQRFALSLPHGTAPADAGSCRAPCGTCTAPVPISCRIGSAGWLPGRPDGLRRVAISATVEHPPASPLLQTQPRYKLKIAPACYARRRKRTSSSLMIKANQKTEHRTKEKKHPPNHPADQGPPTTQNAEREERRFPSAIALRRPFAFACPT